MIWGEISPSHAIEFTLHTHYTCIVKPGKDPDGELRKF